MLGECNCGVEYWQLNMSMETGWNDSEISPRDAIKRCRGDHRTVRRQWWARVEVGSNINQSQTHFATTCVRFLGSVELRCVYFLSFGYRVETMRTRYKRRTNIKTYTMLYYINVLLVPVVWILLICHFSTVFPEIFMKAQNAILTSVFELCVLLSLFSLSCGNYAHTLQATCKHQNIHNVVLY